MEKSFVERAKEAFDKRFLALPKGIADLQGHAIQAELKIALSKVFIINKKTVTFLEIRAITLSKAGFT